MDDQVKIFCKSCGTHVAVFDDFIHQEKGLVIFKEVCNMEVLGPAVYVLRNQRKLIGSLYCKGCGCGRGVGSLEFDESGANDKNEEEDKVYGLILNQIRMMRGDKQIEASSSEAAALFEEGCKRYKLAYEKGKSSDAVNELGTTRKDSGHRKAIKMLVNIRRIREALGNGESAQAVANLGEHFDQQIPAMQIQLTDIDRKIKAVHRLTDPELEINYWKEVNKEMEGMEENIRTIVSVIEGFEEWLVGTMDTGVASDSDTPEKAAKESGTAIEEKTSSSRAATGEGTSSKAVTELRPTEKISTEFTNVGKRLISIIGRIRKHVQNGEGSEATAELGARFETKIQRMQFKLIGIDEEIEKVSSSASTKTEPGKSSEKVNLALERIQRKIAIIASQIGSFEEELAADIDRRQASDTPEKAPKESGRAIEIKASSSRAETGEKMSCKTVTELRSFEKIHSEYTKAAERLSNIISIRESLGNGEGSEAVAKQVELLDIQIPHMQLKLTDIDVEIEKVRNCALTEMELGNSSEELTQAIASLERKSTVTASLIGRFEEDIVSDVGRRQASDAPEKTSKESGTAIEEKTSSSRAATGEGTSSKAITQQTTRMGQQLQYMGSELVDTETKHANLDTRQTSDELEKEVGDSGTTIEEKTSSSRAATGEGTSSKAITQQTTRMGQQLQYMGSELEDTETKHANLDTRQTSDELEKEVGDSGRSVEGKTKCSGAATQKKSQGQKRKERRDRRKSTVTASLTGRFEEDIVSDVGRRQASDAPEKTPKESGTAIEEKTSSSREATGEGTSSKAITQQTTRMGQQLQDMGSELVDTETKHANLDTRQTSDELEKEVGDSGRSVEGKKKCSGAATQKKSQGQKRKERRDRRKSTVTASLTGRFEKDVVSDVGRRQASDAPEKTPKESGTAIEEKTSSSREATGEGTSSKAITQQTTRMGQQLQDMGSELVDTETKHANLDTRQTSDELEKEVGDSGDLLRERQSALEQQLKRKVGDKNGKREETDVNPNLDN